MKEILLYYADCNKRINQDMLQVLKKNIAKPYDLALNGYFFKTLGAILDHVYATDMIWMQSFLNVESFGLDLEKEVGSVPVFGTRVFTDFNAYSRQRSTLDAFILSFVSRIDDTFPLKKVSRKLGNGLRIERDIFKAMIHFFNHQTHHRGQISAILDEMHIENNYSNMIYFDI